MTDDPTDGMTPDEKQAWVINEMIRQGLPLAVAYTNDVGDRRFHTPLTTNDSVTVGALRVVLDEVVHSLATWLHYLDDARNVIAKVEAVRKVAPIITTLDALGPEWESRYSEKVKAAYDAIDDRLMAARAVESLDQEDEVSR